MLETSARLLRVLSLLQAPRDWTGPQLAERLGVTTRTIRKDVERLRTLGYPVTATPGAAGGYRLGAGSALPPLLLDDDEAVAIAVGLRTAAGGSVAGIEEASLRALMKIEQVLPTRLRRRVTTLYGTTASIPRTRATVAGDILTTIATAIRDHERLRFDYDSSNHSNGFRSVQPHLLVQTRGHWYLAAWDDGRADWRTFRVDRIGLRTPNGARFSPREPPPGGIPAFVEQALGSATWRYRTVVTVDAPAAEVAAKLPSWAVVEPNDDHTCRAHVGSDSPHMLALWLGMLDTDFEVNDAPELAGSLRALADRYLRAAPLERSLPLPLATGRSDGGPTREDPRSNETR